MPLVRKLVLSAPVVFAAAVAAPLLRVSGAAPMSQPAPPPVEVEVRCTDDSVLKLKLLDERLVLQTRYGSLQIPASDIRRVEFASRTPPEAVERISLLISNMNHPDFDAREKATAELRGFRERAYLPLLKAIKHPDPEISRRADESVRWLQAKLPAAQLEQRESDVVYTEDSKITGTIAAASLRVQTLQFGEQSLRVADVRTLRTGTGVAAEEVATAATAPANLMAFQNQTGKELVYSVTGPQPTGQTMGVWGTDVYTLYSNLAAAAVHAGLVQPGQSGVVRVRIVPSPPQYVGSTRHGIGSAPYQNYPAGGYEFVRK